MLLMCYSGRLLGDEYACLLLDFKRTTSKIFCRYFKVASKP
jgi:hypothetical protein